MAKKTIIVALTMLLLAAVATFVGVFFGVGRRRQNVYVKAAVAADAGPCSEVGRWELASTTDYTENRLIHASKHTK